MTNITIFRNQNAEICGFIAEDHGDPIVCAAVSALTLNAVNSIEAFTDEDLVYEYNEEDGGSLMVELPEIKKGGHNGDANLLLNSMLLGLQWFDHENAKHINIIDEEVQQ
ncbi:MAG: ribosomal-processing cysteine protease Prp [Clostridiales bacterium]|jgi:uncharacterized protein YsxB (DUF464 family)|nr:ribosomal-processing cysteine protease Prp [Clostridiales bacterium]